jgi:hypothetical protein
MLFCLIIAFLSTFLWLNITIADTVNKARGNDDTVATATSKVKTALAVIMAIFWGIVIRYGGSL